MREAAKVIAALWLANFSLPAFADDCVDKLTPDSKYREVIECFKAQQKELSNLRQASVIPSGAVMVFDLPTGCPLGWSNFERGLSRTIVGASSLHTPDVPNLDMNGQRLRAYPYQSDGGEEKHTLTLTEIPSHDHGILLNTLSTVDLHLLDKNKYPGVVNVGREASNKKENWTVRYTEPNGGGEAHNIMPPFVALFYCRKS